MPTPDRIAPVLRAGGASGWRRRWSMSTPPRWCSNRNPLFEDPIFRRFFGVPDGGSRSQIQRSLGSGVIVDSSGLIVTNVHVIEGADEVKVALADKREFEAEIVLKDKRSDLAVLRLKDAHERFPVLDFANSDALASRRRGARHRQSVRRRPDRDPRHRLGAGAHASRHHRLSVLHPDRRRHQSGQFRRRAGRSRRPAGRHQHRDLLALGRLARHRLCHSRQHGAGGGGLRQSTAARRSSGPGSAPSCRRSPPTSPTAWGSSGRPARWSRA